ncbi:MAG: sigma-54 dependent transcriptional regulator [Pirellulales bacterium]|nr:sigma-54 dependent transcriptional regulator [Pirellulales bacterium]
MDRFANLLLDVWREASRHAESGEAVTIAAPELFRQLPLDVLAVRRLDVERSILETVVTGLASRHAVPERSADLLAPAQLEGLLDWCQRGEVLHSGAEGADTLATLLAGGLRGDVLAGPLNDASGALGVLVCVATAPRKFSKRHSDLVALLLEPFSIWLANERRIRELRRDREAAEADRQALLARLGRTDLNEAIVGAESGLRPVMERIEQVARTDVPVLILGETGSGKEVVARAIHQRSRRADGPFLRVNCGAIPPELVDSELFGHERGSFTGASGLRKGWFERADGGTLFLDECGELPPAVQVRLLRVLQDGSFERVGGEQAMHVDVRIVAATHRHLEAMVTDGAFRQDLWYRLAVFPIHLPPLRDRLEDIPEMAAHFALKSARKLGFPPCLPSTADLNQLVTYNWPGNVRELAAVIERAAILGEGHRLEIAKALGNAPAAVPSRPDGSIFLDAAARVASASSETFPTLDEAMARHIEAALAKTGGRIEGPAGAAKLLGINPHTLRARMRKLKIDWAKHRSSLRHS